MSHCRIGKNLNYSPAFQANISILGGRKCNNQNYHLLIQNYSPLFRSILKQ